MCDNTSGTPSTPDGTTCPDCECSLTTGDTITGLDLIPRCDSCHYEIYGICVVCATVDIVEDIHVCRPVGNPRGEVWRCCNACCFECSDCGDHWRGEAHQSDCGGTYCRGCYYERFSHCALCESECSSDSMVEGEDGYLCESCGERMEEEREENSLLHSSSYTPCPRFHGSWGSTSGPDEGVRYFGIELETEYPERASNTEKAVSKVVTDESLWYAKSDGSLNNGVEFVSHPGTLDFWRKTGFPWASGLVNAGFRSHDTTTCGIHIHVSRNALSETEWLRVAKLFRDSNALVTRAARRASSYYAQNVQGETTGKLRRKIRRTDTNISRYQAINFLNEETVEFRIFKGTLLPSSIQGYVEFVNAVCTFAQNCSLMKMNPKGFHAWLQNTAPKTLGDEATQSLLNKLFPDVLIPA